MFDLEPKYAYKVAIDLLLNLYRTFIANLQCMEGGGGGLKMGGKRNWSYSQP